MILRSTAYYDVIPTATPIETSFGDPCSDKDATHVVDKVIYGKNAYFYFKHNLNSDDDKQAVVGTLHAIVKSIPDVQIEGEGKVILNGTKKKFMESTTMSYYGNFKLPNSPTTFEQAVLAFRELSSKHSSFIISYLITQPVHISANVG